MCSMFNQQDINSQSFKICNAMTNMMISKAQLGIVISAPHRHCYLSEAPSGKPRIQEVVCGSAKFSFIIGNVVMKLFNLFCRIGLSNPSPLRTTIIDQLVVLLNYTQSLFLQIWTSNGSVFQTVNKLYNIAQ